MKTVTLKIQGMHCSSCPIMIDGKLEDEVTGVTSAQTSYAKSECRVEYDENKVDENVIMQMIEGIGYKARYTDET